MIPSWGSALCACSCFHHLHNGPDCRGSGGTSMNLVLFLVKWVLSRIPIIIPVKNLVSQSVSGDLLCLHCIPLGRKCTTNTICSAGAQAICETLLDKEYLERHRRIPSWWPVEGFLQLIGWNSQATHVGSRGEKEGLCEQVSPPQFDWSYSSNHSLYLCHCKFELTFYLQTHIVLHGKGWTVDDGAFKYGVFYQNIVRMFESDPDDEWAKDTIDWWKE